MAIEAKTQGKVFLSPQDASAFARTLVGSIVGAIRVTLDQSVDKLSEKIKNSYESQVLPTGGFPPSYDLKESYKIRKIKEGHDPRIGIRTKSLLNSIKPIKISSNRWFVGTRKAYKSGEKRGRNRRMRIPSYARILEFGNRDQRARPVFRPNLRAFIPQYRDEALQNINTALKGVVRSYGG